MTIHLSKALEVRLSKAILLYSAPHSNDAFATIHNVMTTGDAPAVIGPGQCLSREGLDDALKALNKRPQRREILPSNVLWFGDSRICWFVEAARRPIYFKTTNAKWNEEMNGKEVLHPPLVFLGQPGRLAVWALASNDRPTGETNLYQAPYFNIYDYGAMCNGNAKLPDVPSVESISQYERAFFETNFTHTNTRQLVAGTMGHDGFWRYMLESYAYSKRAWNALLLPLKLTLQGALDK